MQMNLCEMLVGDSRRGERAEEGRKEGRKNRTAGLTFLKCLTNSQPMIILHFCLSNEKKKFVITFINEDNSTSNEPLVAKTTALHKLQQTRQGKDHAGQVFWGALALHY